MKILHIIDRLNRGGAEILALNLCKNANKNNLDLLFVSLGGGDLENDFAETEIEFIKLSRKRSLDLRVIYKLRQIIKQKKVDVVHSHHTVDSVHVYLASLFTRVKTVRSFHGHVRSLKNDVANKFLIPRTDANIAVSKNFLNRLKYDIQYNITRNFHVIYNGIDPNKFFKTDRTLRKELKLSDSDVLLGMVGNFYNTGRDQLTICKALPMVFKKYENVHFVFVGGGLEKNSHYFDECFNFCKSNNILNKTHFAGLRTDINKILNSLDIFVYSSNHDTFGISVIEAMISGLPVILNDLNTLLEITDNGKYAYVFKTKDEGSLFDRISKLLDSAEKRESISKSGKEWAIKNFTIDCYVKNLKNLYKSLI